MSEETWDRVLGDIFAALDRDAAAEGRLIAIAPLLSDEQILRAWVYLAHDEASRWRARGALAHEALQRVMGRAERDGRGTAAVRQLAAALGIEPGRVYRLAQIHGVIEGGALDVGIVEVLPEMVWYDEALAAPDRPTTTIDVKMGHLACYRLSSVTGPVLDGIKASTEPVTRRATW